MTARTPDPSPRTPKPAASNSGTPAAGASKSRTPEPSATQPRTPKAGAAKSRTPGRRPGGPDTRGEILRAARESFAGKGFTATSLRAVARHAGVDAALVHHYFDSKDALFVEAMALPIDPRQIAAHVLSGPPEELARRILTVFLGVWESPDGQQRMKAVLRSVVSNDDVARLMREGISQLVIIPVAQSLGVPDAQFRVTLAATQLMGVAMARYVVELEPLASCEIPELIDRMAPAIQHYLTG